jgi:hypothetical protein
VVATQIEERRNRKAEEARRLAEEEAAVEDRVARERAELVEVYKREEAAKKDKEEQERKRALEEQIAAKQRAREVEAALEKEVEEREAAKRARQRKEIADAYARESGNGPAAAAPPPQQGKRTKHAGPRPGESVWPLSRLCWALPFCSWAAKRWPKSSAKTPAWSKRPRPGWRGWRFTTWQTPYKRSAPTSCAVTASP